MKNIIKLTGLVLLAVLANVARSQSINYKIVENEPDRKNLYIFLNPFNINTYMSDINIGVDLQALWLANRRLSAELDFRKAYLDENTHGVYTPKNLSNAGQMQLGVVYNFSSKLKNIQNKVTLMSFSFGGYSYSKYVKVVAEARRTAGFRGGVVYFHNNYKVRSFSDDGSDIVKADNGEGKLVPVRDSVTFETVSYTGKSLGVYAGIDLKTIRDVLIDADGYGEKSNRNMNNFYLDVLFAPAVNYKIRPNDNQAYLAKADVNISDNARKLLGWRLGWQAVLKKDLGFNCKIELGQQPGRPVKSLFLNFGMGFNFGLKVKSL